jgi:hypothetical protein
LPRPIRRGDHAVYENKQLINRLPSDFVRRVLNDFNAGNLDAITAASQLGVGRSRLYELRFDFLRAKDVYAPEASGGNRRNAWPLDVERFLQEFIPLQRPPNYQLVADELLRLHGFMRARSTVESYIKTNLSHLIPTVPKKPQPYRRFRRAYIGELWQHDSCIHQWWPAELKQVLLLSVDDHSGMIVAGRFVDGDTTWNHFLHFRSAFEVWGIPEIIYTDGLSLFGPSSTHDHSDPKSEFQRALLGLGVAHLVAPTPQAKGKIERAFGTFQKRMVTLLAHAKVTNELQADEVLQMEILRQNRKVKRTTGQIPYDEWDRQSQGPGKMRVCSPPELLDLHLAMRCQRRVNNDHTINFDGHNYEISPTLKKSVTIVHHPKRQIWVVEHAPKDIWPPILGRFTL